ncbi:thioredoxin family protein [Sedimenticola sp.]|uniref:thioredoxin family protein n=1 Tax=Sedimenticola sp. TaxID=1940285 RepID=UPI003D1216DD
MKQLTALFLSLSALVIFSESQAEYSPSTSTITATNLQADGEAAQRDNKAILLLVSQEHCSYCVAIKRDVIVPMIMSGNYKNNLLIRELHLDGTSTVIDFDGVERDSYHFTYNYKVSVTPTLLFLDGRGKELAEKMVGFQTPDMYYYYVDQSIQESLKRLGMKTGQ